MLDKKEQLAAFLNNMRTMHLVPKHAAAFAIFQARIDANNEMHGEKAGSNAVADCIVDEIASYILNNTLYQMSELHRIGNIADELGYYFVLPQLLKVEYIDEIL